MKTIVKSLIVIAAVAALAIGATSAIFSDQESIPENTFATGTLDLTLNHSQGKPFSVTGAYPGYQTDWEHMDVFNGPHPPVAGQLPFEAFLWLQKTAGSSSLYGTLEIDLYDSGWNSVCGDGDDVLIYSGNLWSITNWQNRTQTSDNDPNAGGTPGNDDIRPGWSQRICQRLRLPSTASNALQGTSVTFTEFVDAVQNDD